MSFNDPIPTTSTPPPPPPPVKKSRKWMLFLFIPVGLFIIGIVVAGAVAVSSSAAGPSMVDVIYTVTVKGHPCEEISESGYADIGNYSQVRAMSDSKQVLGYGRLNGGVNVDREGNIVRHGPGAGCIFMAQFDVKRSPDRIYQFQTGKPSRDYVRFNQDWIRGDTLIAWSYLGSY